MEQQTVFIIDDDAAVRDSIQELVESVGLRAQCYASGQAFLDDLQLQRPGWFCQFGGESPTMSR